MNHECAVRFLFDHRSKTRGRPPCRSNQAVQVRDRESSLPYSGQTGDIWMKTSQPRPQSCDHRCFGSKGLSGPITLETMGGFSDLGKVAFVNCGKRDLESELYANVQFKTGYFVGRITVS